MQDLNYLVKTLLSHDLDFLIVGGFAAVVHGSSHVTKDLDITMLMSPENVERLRSALKDLEPRHRMNPTHKPSFLDDPKEVHGLKNIYLETKAGILDVVTLDENLGSYQDLKDRAVVVTLFGHDCQVLSLDDLIAIKEKMGRRKDLIVLEELRAIKKQQTS
ncbi:MAG: nucleotidyltransferase [Bdellovibrionales bacterium]